MRIDTERSLRRRTVVAMTGSEVDIIFDRFGVSDVHVERGPSEFSLAFVAGKEGKGAGSVSNKPPTLRPAEWGGHRMDSVGEVTNGVAKGLVVDTTW